MIVKEIIDKIEEVSGVSIPEEVTCDKLISGSPDMEVKKIGCTFMATVDVIKKAAEEGVNFIITHEPTWFNGNDHTEWVEEDPVYQEKKRLIQEKQIAIWRDHDHMHMTPGDQIYMGFDQWFGWDSYKVPSSDIGPYLENDPEKGVFWKSYGAVYELPQTTLRNLADFFKEKINMDVVQIVGDPDMPVKRVSVQVGGGSLGLGREEAPMIQMFRDNIDVVICGDITEWTLSAYVRDAAALGMNKGMLVLGHERSEEWGMEYLTRWLQGIVGDIPVVFIDAGEPFSYL